MHCKQIGFITAIQEWVSLRNYRDKIYQFKIFNIQKLHMTNLKTTEKII